MIDILLRLNDTIQQIQIKKNINKYSSYNIKYDIVLCSNIFQYNKVQSILKCIKILILGLISSKVINKLIAYGIR